jgi:(R,R)-butanediol dehydrogenase/meso-butanediol dehydrogenase/diacetyl reductase
MKAAVWHDRNDVRIEEVPDPKPPKHGQVTIETAFCGICGTDLHEYESGPLHIPVQKPHPLTGVKAPVILGHEIAGKVVDTGPGVTHVEIGDRVALCPIIGCLKCRWCKSGLMGLCTNVAFLGTSWSGGGFARLINVFEYMCYKIPPKLDYDVASLVEPFAATLRAVKQANVQKGETVAVTGAGPIGLMAIQSARIIGATRIIAVEPASARRKLALQCQATEVIDPTQEDPVSRIAELTDGEGADVVIECSGVDAAGILAGRIARKKGRIAVMGVFPHAAPLDYTDLVYNEKTVFGTMGGFGIFPEAIQRMANGEFNGDPLITGRIGLDDLLIEGFETLIKHKEQHVKILVSPQ